MVKLEFFENSFNMLKDLKDKTKTLWDVYQEIICKISISDIYNLPENCLNLFGRLKLDSIKARLAF